MRTISMQIEQEEKESALSLLLLALLCSQNSNLGTLNFYFILLNSLRQILFNLLTKSIRLALLLSESIQYLFDS